MAAGPSTSEAATCFVTCHEPSCKYLGAVKRNVETNEEYVAFYDVPYGKRPCGLEERYQAPKPVELNDFAWLTSCGEYSFFDDYDATKPTEMKCTQVTRDGVEGSADCLYLNIYLPSRPEFIEELLPVLVFFHGGGFTNGDNSPKTYTPDSIIQHGVIFITVSYRIGLYGFFNLHTKKCPGNAGLKDQVRALEWIRDNIKSFCGNPYNVTISGSQSGATCVNLHLVSPMSRGLFHKAIVQSGGVYCPWGYRGYGRAVKEAITSDSECKRLLFSDQVEYKLHKRADHLLRADHQIRNPFLLSSLYGPTTETIKEGAFITGKIDEIMQAEVDPKIPILAGICINEGINRFTVDEIEGIEKVILEPISLVRILTDNFHWNLDTALKYVNEIKSRYLPNQEYTPRSLLNKRYFVSKLFHDISFRRFYDNFKFGPKRTLHKNLFVYQFEHSSGVRRFSWNDMIPVGNISDELQYLYRPQWLRGNHNKVIADSDAKYVTEHMCSLWATFCKTDGVPGSEFASHVKWRPHTEEKPCYLRINKDLVLEEGRLCEAAWDWLNSLVNDGKPVVESRLPTPE